MDIALGWQGIGDGMVDIVALNDKLPNNLKEKVLNKRNAIADGVFHPFTGPVKNQKGKTVVKKGESMSDGQLQSMNYYVKGVLSEFPK